MKATIQILLAAALLSIHAHALTLTDTKRRALECDLVSADASAAVVFRGASCGGGAAVRGGRVAG